MTVEFEYQKPGWKSVAEKKSDVVLQISNVSVTYSQMDFSKFPNMLPLVKIRCGEALVQTEFAKAPGTSMQWPDKFQMVLLKNKIFCDVHLLEPVKKMDEVIGTGLIRQQELTVGQETAKVDLSYRGKIVGILSFQYDYANPNLFKQEVKSKDVDIKKLHVSQEEQKKREILEKKKEIMKQKLWDMQMPKMINDFKTPKVQVIEKTAELRLPIIKTHDVITIPKQINLNYKNGIFGVGFSHWNSATSL